VKKAALPKKAKAPKAVMPSQEALLAEAVGTEAANIQSLADLRRLEDMKKKLSNMKRAKPRGAMVCVRSDNGGVTRVQFKPGLAAEEAVVATAVADRLVVVQAEIAEKRAAQKEMDEPVQYDEWGVAKERSKKSKAKSKKAEPRKSLVELRTEIRAALPPLDSSLLTFDAALPVALRAAAAPPYPSPVVCLRTVRFASFAS
jgi:hypothetical protein